MPPQIWALEF